MTTSPPPPLKSLPSSHDRPLPATQPGRAAAVGGPKGAARQGVPSVPRSNPQPGDGRNPVAWLGSAAPTSWMRISVAEAWRSRGRHRTARDKADVLRLIADHTAHHDACALRTAAERKPEA